VRRISVVKKPKTKPTPAPKKYYAPLTGREVPDEAATKRAITAIIRLKIAQQHAHKVGYKEQK